MNPKPQLHKLPIRVDTEEGVAECVVEISKQKQLNTLARPEQEEDKENMKSKK